MDPPAGRRKKDDKAKEKYQRNGGYSQKHVRLTEALVAKRATAGKSIAASSAPATKHFLCKIEMRRTLYGILPVRMSTMSALDKSRISNQHSDIELAQLAEELKEKRILIPAHQREYCWNITLQRNFVLSILRNYPVPSMLMSKDRGETSPSIEDGRQRLTTAMRFRDNYFDVEGKYYKDLSPIQQERFDTYKIHLITFSGATLDERICIFDWFNSGKKLTSGEHCHNQARTPLVALAKRLFMTVGSGIHDRAEAIWGVQGDTPGSEGPTKDKGRKGLINAVAFCMGLLYGPANVTKNYDHIKQGYMTRPITPQLEAAVQKDLERVLEIYEAVEAAAPMGRKKLKNKQWDLGSFTGYILYSLSITAREEYEATQMGFAPEERTPFEHVYEPNSLEGNPEEWKRLKDGWIDYMVGVRRALDARPGKKLAAVLAECLHKGVSKARNWKLERWEDGYLRVFAPSQIVDAASTGSTSDDESDSDE